MATQLQALGIQNIPVYANAAALTLDQQQFVVGQLALLESPPMLVIATETLPSSYITSSTYTLGNASVTTYWTQLSTPSESNGQSTPFTARAVANVVHAYTGTGTGTLTSTANGLISGTAGGSTDTIVVAAGDQIFFPAGITNVTAVDSGPWTVITPGTASTPWQVKRPWWFTTGNKWVSGQEVKIGCEGGVMGGTTWKATAAAGIIDTTDAAWYVKELTFQVTLSSGTLALPAGQPTTSSNYPLATGTCNFPTGIYSATKSNIAVALAAKGGTATTTVGYSAANVSSSALCTAGYVGTSAAAVFALAVALATQTGDTSTVQVTLTNFG